VLTVDCYLQAARSGGRPKVMTRDDFTVSYSYSPQFFHFAFVNL